uniref:Uncharacterized protein n=2 Tax=Oryza TaxID=4527 RepID=A0A0E0FWM2_ORYNI
MGPKVAGPCPADGNGKSSSSPLLSAASSRRLRRRSRSRPRARERDNRNLLRVAAAGALGRTPRVAIAREMPHHISRPGAFEMPPAPAASRAAAAGCTPRCREYTPPRAAASAY